MTKVRRIDRWISKDELSRYELPVATATMHYNHEDCPAGRDTRQRLYITRTNDNTILAYCHNCGHRGFIRSTDPRNIHEPAIDECTPVVGDPLGIPAILTAQIENLGSIPTFPIDYSSQIQQYMDTYGISQLMAAKDAWMYGSSLDTKTGVLVYPCLRTDTSIIGGQVRRVGPVADGVPKVVSFGTVEPHLFDPYDSDTVIVCEDRVSGVKIAQAGFASYVLHGSQALTGVQAHSLAMLFKNVLVWYDNDNDTVKQAAETSHKVLTLFKHTQYIGLERVAVDPKRHSIGEILAVVGRAFI